MKTMKKEKKKTDRRRGKVGGRRKREGEGEGDRRERKRWSSHCLKEWSPVTQVVSFRAWALQVSKKPSLYPLSTIGQPTTEVK